MTLIIMFGKLQEREMRLDRLEKHEGQRHKVRYISLKTKVKML